MAACFIRASEQRGEGGWGVGAGRSHHPFTLILRHPTASVDPFLGILSEILTGLRSYLQVNELPYHSYLCESLLHDSHVISPCSVTVSVHDQPRDQ